MSLPIVLRSEAQAEFDEAFDYYEIKKVFERIGANPLLHAVVFADVRKAVVARFPYCVFYRAEAAQVQVIAVFHSSRDVSIWQDRT